MRLGKVALDRSPIIRQSLPAATVPALAGGTIRLDDHMAELGSEAVEAPIYHSADYDSRPDALLDVDEQQVRTGPIGKVAVPDLGQGRQIGLVVDQDAGPEPPLQALPQRKIGPTEIRGQQHCSGVVVNQPRDG